MNEIFEEYEVYEVQKGLSGMTKIMLHINKIKEKIRESESCMTVVFGTALSYMMLTLIYTSTDLYNLKRFYSVGSFEKLNNKEVLTGVGMESVMI